MVLGEKMFLVDSHCHLDMLDLAPDNGQLDSILSRAKLNGIGHMLNVCVTLADFGTVLNTAKKYDHVSASVGMHPNEEPNTIIDFDTLLMNAKEKKVVAIGETGLDYFRSEGNLSWQHERFRQHIAVAKQVNKPLIIHTRAAKEDTLQIMRDEKANEASGVMHCFTEDWEFAKKALEMNFYISFSGIVTFKNAQELQTVAKNIPLDKMLIETDSPYLAPNPYRGKPNEPAYVRYVAEHIAQLRDISLEELAHHTTNNFFTLFKEAKRHDV
jgi:TatD DNase family protein